MTRAAAPDRPAPAPDRSGRTDPVCCPLCDYDLRGLPEPRCPECGYACSWAELLDPARRLHPYLFEHHPDHPFQSFWRTLYGGCRPGRFWRTVFPTQPSRPKRLVRYWMLAAVPLVLGMLVTHAFLVLSGARDVERSRAAINTWPAGLLGDVTRDYGSVQRYVDVAWPRPPSLGFFRNVYRRGPGPATWLALMWLAWPWLTFVTLLVFRISMRRARIKPVHVLRCVLYSFDGVFWVGWLYGIGMAARLFEAQLGFSPPLVRWPGTWAFILPPIEGPGVAALFLGGVVVAGLMVYRLVVAFKLYLKFDRPVATVLALQAIVVLAVLVVDLVPPR